MSRVVGVGAIGAGVIFEQHARALAPLADRARLVAVADVDEDRLRAAARHGVAHLDRDHADLLDRSDVELVAVCTPPHLHERIVLDALAAGKHVVCEKPLAPTLAAADRIVDAAHAFPGRLSVVHQFRWLPEVRRTIWLRDSDRLGRLLFGRFHRYARFHRPGKPTRATWWGSWEVAGGGVVMTQLIHELDLMCHIFGRPIEVSAMLDTLKEEIESEDACAATVRFENGAICSCYGTMSAHRSTAGFDVIGTRASAHGPWAFESLDRELRAEARQAALRAHPDADPADSAHAPYLAAVLDALEAGRPLPVGPQEARDALELCVAVYASALSGAPVALPIARTDPHYGGITRRAYEARDGSRRGQERALEPVAG
jgi:UDP-N-acetyl-2-amino-2-deoxyglucuronate dehydrogenase